jgi:hypothetical protein
MALDFIIETLENVVNTDIDQIIQDIIVEYQTVLIDLLRFQMSKGIDADGEPLKGKHGSYYTDKTIAFKLAFGSGLGREIDRVTNYMFGDFYSEMYVVLEGDNFQIYSDVSYFEDIVTRSGYRAMELSEESLNEFRESYIIPELEKRLNFK